MTPDSPEMCPWYKFYTDIRILFTLFLDREPAEVQNILVTLYAIMFIQFSKLWFYSILIYFTISYITHRHPYMYIATHMTSGDFFNLENGWKAKQWICKITLRVSIIVAFVFFLSHNYWFVSVIDHVTML